MGLGGGGEAVALAGGPETRIKLADPDEATYFGRVRKTFRMLDFRTAFTTDHALQDALALVEAKAAGKDVDADAYDHALKIKHAIVHPDTGEAVFTPLRVSMIVPMNVIVDCGMILASTTRQTIFAQWLNQTYNALHYYANRNASNEDTAEQRLVAYVGATASSVAASLGIRHWAKQMQNAKWAPIVARMGPFAAVAAADLLNLAVMRQSEYLKGVNIYDENGDCVGKSKRCGALAVASCITGRIFAAAPILIVPPLVMRRLERKPFLTRTPWLRVPLLLGMVGTMIQFSVPVTFGLFRQTAQLNVKYLEPEIAANAMRKDGQRVHVITYNKGI
uniref:Sidoreflexin n=1 Tax=Globisporangium ultimum (strain ATCC 200006 / CBS 805.95 / DAOM BR144) TaxID=431595 RepID=K3X8B4_GLOUD